VLVDLARDDPGARDDVAVVRDEVWNDDHLERVVPVLAADLVDPFAALAGFGETTR